MSSILCSGSVFARQVDMDELFIGGFYARAGWVQFDKALILDQFGNSELVLAQSKNGISIGAGIAAVPKEVMVGINLGANFWTTKLEDLRTGTSLYDPIFKDIRYSMLLFDFSIYLAPISLLPVALTFGLTLGGSFHSYRISADIPQYLLFSGDISNSMFRYGTILGCKITPSRFFSLDIEYRPMSAYSESQSAEYLYTKGDYNYYRFTGEKIAGPSEHIFMIGLSIYR
ncbi:MAG: hypothetical protein ABIA75_09890 [Candidatus Neomarinimicrobiota bacterium]